MSDENMVPLSRLTEKNETIKALELKLAEATMANKDLATSAKQLDKWKARFEAEQVAHENTRKSTSERFTLLEAGIVDEADQQLARWKYGQLEGDDRPSLSDYLKGAALQDRHLATILKPAETSETPEPPAEPGQPTPPVTVSAPRENAGVKPNPNGASANEHERIMGLTDEEFAAEFG